MKRCPACGNTNLSEPERLCIDDRMQGQKHDVWGITCPRCDLTQDPEAFEVGSKLYKKIQREFRRSDD